MAVRLLPPVEFLRECFDYDLETGVLRWRQRPPSHFSTAAIAKAWNSKLAGTVGFSHGTREGHLRAEIVYSGARYRLYAARVAFKLVTGDDPEAVDHVDGNPRNNRFANLRAATLQQNTWNLSKTRAASKLRGAFFEKGRWASSVNVDGRKIRLGRFDTALEAHEAYCAYGRAQRGEFFNPGANVLA